MQNSSNISIKIITKSSAKSSNNTSSKSSTQATEVAANSAAKAAANAAIKQPDHLCVVSQWLASLPNHENVVAETERHDPKGRDEHKIHQLFPRTLQVI